MSKPKKPHISKYVYTDVVSLVNRYAKDKKTVLEIGCGTGNNLYYFAENGFDTYGIDSDEVAITYAKDFLKSKKLKADMRVGDVMALPYQSGMFDVVLDRACLQHNTITKIKKIMTEVVRVLVRGGVFILINIRSKKDSGAKNFKKDTTFKEYNYVHFTDKKELTSLLKNFKLNYFEHRINTISIPEKYIQATYILVAQKL